MWVYMRTEPGCYTVGFHAPDGEWHTDSDHGSKSEAAERVRWLNGGEPTQNITTSNDKLNFGDYITQKGLQLIGETK